jgi:hypothetical protein
MITLGNLTGFGRAVVRDGCTGKRGFASYAEAEREIGRLIRKHAHRPEQGTLAPYVCPWCRQVHLGHFKH